MTSSAWDPRQYALHSAHRNRPIADLLARVPALPEDEAPRIADLGCGPGGPSLMLAERWPAARITGYDNSPAMLHEARAYEGSTSAGGSLEFTHADLAAWSPEAGERFDLIFSNAALQWVLAGDGNGGSGGGTRGGGGDLETGAAGPEGAERAEGHELDERDEYDERDEDCEQDPLPEAAVRPPGHTALFPAWIDALPRGGVFAFQVPGNFDAPSHSLLLELRNSPRWRGRLGSASRNGSVLDPPEYLAVLDSLGCETDAWETTYAQLLRPSGPVGETLPDEDPVLDWVKGTTLRPVLALLADDPEARSAFLDEYARLLRAAYPPLGGDPARGTVFPFRRIFAVAVKR